MKIIVLILLLLTNSNNGCLQADIILLVDSSSSVFNSQAFINSAVKSFRNKFQRTQVKVGLITFNDIAEIGFHLGDTITTSIFPNGGSNLLYGLRLSVEELSGKYSTEENRKMIIIISDGLVYDRELCAQYIKEMKQKGIGIMGVQIGKETDFLEKNCDVFVDTDYEGLGNSILEMDICL